MTEAAAGDRLVSSRAGVVAGLVLAGGLGFGFQGQDGTGEAPEVPVELAAARETFVELCAPCHGVAGDGRGTAELERPARSFAEGGFSFGNTTGALVRTLESGIPGTPMPAFGGQLSRERLTELARLVQLLGPGGEPEPPRGTVLEVGDRPLIVRGMLPSLVEGGAPILRGLLLGEPSGMSFQYAADDVRLLRVRLGAFVDRADWGGRGGSALLPLGKVVHSPLDPTRPARWRGPDGGPLHARLQRTSTASGAAMVEVELVTADGDRLATVTESPRMVATGRGSGYALAFTLRPHARGRVDLHPFPSTTDLSWSLTATAADSVVCYRPLESPGTELRLMTLARGVTPTEGGLRLDLVPGQALRLEVAVVLLTEWSPENAVFVLQEVARGDR
ncbi:MAG: c-type cytochrome [Planctomycetota bacterium]|jgi:mono/diheme cytochrome c family protein|nr:c-type cytochrome [Planctomycetota bacterium]MDP6763762.1 c-type cytochrome [Planctomycetota bacterium]MDP6990001.1 c-type cytochrome [Planctomycetota bacterium]